MFLFQLHVMRTCGYSLQVKRSLPVATREILTVQLQANKKKVCTRF